MLGKKEQGITIKLSKLFDIAPDQEFQSFISAETIKECISQGLTELGIDRCIDESEKSLKNKKDNPNSVDDNTVSNASPDPPLPGSSVLNSLSVPCDKLTQRTSYGTKHQTFGQKRHFSLSQDCKHQDLNSGYPGLRIGHRFSQEDAQIDRDSVTLSY